MFDEDTESVLFGVCKPLGNYIGISPVTVRILFLVWFMFSPSIFLIYCLIALFV